MDGDPARNGSDGSDSEGDPARNGSDSEGDPARNGSDCDGVASRATATAGGMAGFSIPDVESLPSESAELFPLGEAPPPWVI